MPPVTPTVHVPQVQNGLVVYTQYNKIYVMNADGSQPRQLTHDTGDELDPIWTLDGQHILFSSKHSRQMRSGIYMMNMDGTEMRHISSLNMRPSGLAWSPDGSKAIFSAFPRDDDYVDEFNTLSSLYIMDRNGSTIERLTFDINAVSPLWSPDGTKIVFASLNQAQDGRNLYLMNADGTNIHQLTYGKGWDLPKYWLSDGQILFHSMREEYSNFYLYVVNQDGTNLHRFFDMQIPAGYAYYESFLCLSPDRTHLLVERHYDKGHFLVIAEIQNPNMNYTIEDYNGGGIWSPDGTQIQYFSGYLSHTLTFININEFGIVLSETFYSPYVKTWQPVWK